MVTVCGTLHRVVGIGGETTGWAIELRVVLEVTEGMKVNDIEVDTNGKDIEALNGKHIQVTGDMTWRDGIERRHYPVIVIETIRELKND